MSDKSTIFKITAANCKQWADEVNSDKYCTLLEDIAVEARSGKYYIHYNNLPEVFKDKLEADGFVVSHDQGDDVYFISWQ